jgi:hypothetical protein
MTANDRDQRKYIHGALLLTVQQASDLEAVQGLVDKGRQVVVMIPSRMGRADHDSLTEQLMDLAGRAVARLTVIQVGSSRPKGWRRWLARLNSIRTFIVTPKNLDEPSVAVFWAPEADTGVERLVVGELTAIKASFRET